MPLSSSAADLADVRKLDDELLRVFRELLRRRRASDVAEHLGLTQSAISHRRVVLGLAVGHPAQHGVEASAAGVKLL